MSLPDSRPEELRRRLLALGFDEARFASIPGPLPDPLPAWLAAGHHAEMHWMERTAAQRLDPRLVLPGARSVVMLGVNYWSDALRTPQAGASRWARYALHEDYHDTIRPALAAAAGVLAELFGAAPEDTRYYVDTGPVLERSWAVRAGLGFTGKNAMLISRHHGNWLFLAALLTRVPLPADPPASPPGPRPTIGTWCGKCTRCLDQCPTDAFTAPGVLDARRCVSYQTIENKGVIPRELRPGIGNRVYGCDTCLEVCPWNRFAQAGRAVLLSARHDLADLTLPALLDLTPETFAVTFRRTAVKRVKLTGLLRNACVVAGNSGDRSLLPRLLRLAGTHASPLVRAHAVWAVRQLDATALPATPPADETDPTVRAEYA